MQGDDPGREREERAYRTAQHKRLRQIRGHMRHMQDHLREMDDHLRELDEHLRHEEGRARGGTENGTTLRRAPSARAAARTRDEFVPFDPIADNDRYVDGKHWRKYEEHGSK